MTGRVKIIGTNKATEKFENAEFKEGRLFENVRREKVLRLEEKEYFLDATTVEFKETCFLFNTMITDGKNFVGRLAFEFYPKSS